MGRLGGLRVTALLLLAALSLFTAFSPMAQALRHAVFDTYQRVFPLERKQAPVRVVLIDENTIAKLGQWPWPRTRIAYLVERIHAHQPLAIALDLIFPEPDRYSPASMAAELPIIPTLLQQLLESLPTNDQRFSEAIRDRDVVLGIAADRAVDERFPRPPRAAPVVVTPRIQATLERYPGHIATIDLVDAAAKGRGIMNSGPQDQIVRRVPLVADVHGAIVPSLGVEAVRVAEGAGVRVAEAGPGLARLNVGKFAVFLQDNGETWLRFSRHTDAYSVPAHAVMTGDVDAALLRDHIVLIGVSGLGVLDYKTTALGQFVPGVYMHAQVIQNLVNGVSLVRPEWASGAEAVLLVLCSLLLIFVVPRLSALQGINLALGLVVLLAGLGLVAFLQFDTLLDPVWPSIGTLAVFGSVVVGTLSEADRQRRVLREEAAHLAGEVDAARRIQMGLLPNPKETLSHDRRFAIAAFLEPARTVGGDFYDCFMVDVRRLFFIVADVSGKGLPAALFMAAAKSNVKSAAMREHDIGEVLTRAQEEIMRENPEQLFVTAFAGVLDVQTGMLEYANAGHEPPFRRKVDGVPERFARPGGPPLCVLEDFTHVTERTQLQPGEWVVVVTDGATEAMNPAREFFGLERLRTTLSWMPAGANPEEIIHKVDEDVKKFAAGAESADDLTLLAFRWEGPRTPGKV